MSLSLLYIDLPGEVNPIERWEDETATDDYLTCTVCTGPASPAVPSSAGVRCWRCDAVEHCQRCGQTVDAGAFFGAAGVTCWPCTNAAVQVRIGAAGA